MSTTSSQCSRDKMTSSSSSSSNNNSEIEMNASSPNGGSEDYVVEAIRNWRFNLRAQCKEYLIKWQNYKEEENTWEPETNLNCPLKLKEFANALTGKQARYFNVVDHNKLTGFQRNAIFKRCVGVDGPHDSDDEEFSEKIDKQTFYCLITFEDSDYAEEVTIREFLDYEPKEALKFMESRFFLGD